MNELTNGIKYELTRKKKVCVFGVSQWYQWYTNIVQGFTNSTNGNAICTNGNANGTMFISSQCSIIKNYSVLFCSIGSPNGKIGANCTIGKPMVPLATNGTIGKITNDTIGGTPNGASIYAK